MTRDIIEALEKLQTAHTYHDPRLDFMKSYAYDLGMDDLVKYGADQYVIGFEISHLPSNVYPCSLSVRSYDLGRETFKRYRSLLAKSGHVPFVRASGSKRVVLSARNWTHGAFLICKPETVGGMWIHSST